MSIIERTNLIANPRYIGTDGKAGGGAASWGQADVEYVDIEWGLNLVSDPRFVGPDGKTGGNSAAWAQEDLLTGGPDGRGWTKITATTDATGAVFIGNDAGARFPATVGQTYTASVHLLLPGAGLISHVRVQVVWRDAEGGALVSQPGGHTYLPGPGWRRYAFTTTAPDRDGLTYGEVRVCLNYVANDPGNVMAGDVFGVAMRMATQGADLLAYYDGDSPPIEHELGMLVHYWLGEVNDSISRQALRVAGPDGGGFTLVTATADQTGVVDIGTDAGARTPVTPGQTYTALTHMLAVQPMYQFYVYLQWQDADGKGINTNGADATPNPRVGQWQQMQVSATAPADAAFAQVRARLSYKPELGPPMLAGHQYGVGCRMLETGDHKLTTADYFDGDSPGVVWYQGARVHVDLQATAVPVHDLDAHVELAGIVHFDAPCGPTVYLSDATVPDIAAEREVQVDLVGAVRFGGYGDPLADPDLTPVGWREQQDPGGRLTLTPIGEWDE